MARKAQVRQTRNRHGRRPARSSLTGPYIANPESRVTRFDADARAIVMYLQSVIPELQQVHFGYVTMPDTESTSEMPEFYSINRAEHTILLHRAPIQRAPVLHIPDDDHRKMFLGHCIYRAACEYLGEDPWELLPGRFDHY